MLKLTQLEIDWHTKFRTYFEVNIEPTLNRLLIKSKWSIIRNPRNLFHEIGYAVYDVWLFCAGPYNNKFLIRLISSIIIFNMFLKFYVFLLFYTLCECGWIRITTIYVTFILVLNIEEHRNSQWLQPQSDVYCCSFLPFEMVIFFFKLSRL